MNPPPIKYSSSYSILNVFSIKYYCKWAIKHIFILRWLQRKFNNLLESDYFCKHANVINNGYGSMKKKIRGNNNKIIIGNNTVLSKTMFHIIGNNNVIEIGKDCTIGKNCSFWMEGNNIKISIGDKCSFTMLVHFNAQEDYSQIIVEDDAMFSNKIIVRTSDSHPIYDMTTGKRINNAKNIHIGQHVWIAPDTKIMKGAKIGSGCIIGSNTIINNEIPCNCLAVGMPAKVVKTNVEWTREDIIFKKKINNI